MNRSLRVSLLSGIKKTGIPIFFYARLKSRIHFFDLPGGLFLIPYRRLTLRSAYP
ncbi:MAG: hypothetical protein HUU50_14900 [Candidatus Brocadiae bacterium]|nr:hypothetical protein [Candidatus Brocadiia bacterium]